MKHFEMAREGEVVVLTALRELLGGEETDELEAAIGEVVREGNRDLVLDLGRSM